METSVFYIKKGSSRIEQIWQSIKRSFREFLSVPSLIIIAFFILAICSNLLDHGDHPIFKPVRALMKNTIFQDPKATSTLLGTIASSIITVLSLTITLLLIVVQQSATTMTAQVFDQFLRSRHNQTYFGFFVGLAFYSLILLSTVNQDFNPVIGASFAFILSVVALYLLIILVYTTINDMRPAVIISSIYDQVMLARDKQVSFIRKTRNKPQLTGNWRISVKTTAHGYITRIHLDRIDKFIKNINNETEVVLLVSIGDYVAFHDELAYVTANAKEDGCAIGNAVGNAIELEKQRDIGIDPGDGVEQLRTIAWTSVSTAKQSPYPGLLVIRNLRDVLLHWSEREIHPAKNVYPIVYKDTGIPVIMETFESLAIISSESMQHQVFIEILFTFITSFNRISEENKKRTEDIILRMLSAMGDFVLTAALERKLEELIKMLISEGRNETAAAVQKAKDRLKESVGIINSRSTRIK